MEHCFSRFLGLRSKRLHPPPPLMELNFLGNNYTTCNEPKEKTVVQLKCMGKAYQASMSNASRAVTALTYRGVSYSH